MRKTMTTALITALVVVGAIFPGSAAAKNRHQDHRGACARSTTSINKGVGDLKYNGVVDIVARRLGIKAYNGSLTKQLKNQLVIGRVYRSKRTSNHGCDGHGRMFGAGKRTLYKGELVAVKVPAKYGKDACSRPSKRCKTVIIKVKTSFPTSCWNPNYGWVKVKIWIKRYKPVKPPKPTPPKPPAPPMTPPPPPGCVVIVNGNNSGNAGCGNVQICTANSAYNNDMALCSQYMQCVAIQGNTWNSTQNVCAHVPPPHPPAQENHQPGCAPYKVPQHVYPRMGFVIEVSCEDPDGDAITVRATAQRGNLSFLGQTGTTYRYQYTAPATVGDEKVTFYVTDSKGASGVPLVVSFPNPVDER